jgi:hypothetical protein
MAPLSYSPNTGEFISRAAAKDGIDEYKASDAFDANDELKAHFFGKNKIDEVMAQSGCIGIRIWYGIGPNDEDEMAPQLYIVGVDVNGNDILPTGQEKVLDASMPCPKYCPTGSSLEN